MMNHSAFALEAAIDEYFRLEVLESWVFVIVGALMLLLAFFAASRRHAFGRGLATGLGVVALIQLGVGGSILWRTTAQVAALKLQLARDSAAMQAAEAARMQVVMRWFDIYFWIEIGFILMGAALLFAVARQPSFWRGLGLGMLIQGALMLPADLLAKSRGQQYLDVITPSRLAVVDVPRSK